MIIEITRKGEPACPPNLSYRRCADGFGSDDDSVFHVEFDAGEQDVAVLVVRSVAAILDRRPADLEPLGDVIDPEMLESMVREGARGTAHNGEYQFTYEGFEVTVDTSGNLWLER